MKAHSNTLVLVTNAKTSCIETCQNKFTFYFCLTATVHGYQRHRIKQRKYPATTRSSDSHKVEGRVGISSHNCAGKPQPGTSHFLSLNQHRNIIRALTGNLCLQLVTCDLCYVLSCV